MDKNATNYPIRKVLQSDSKEPQANQPALRSVFPVAIILVPVNNDDNVIDLLKSLRPSLGMAFIILEYLPAGKEKRTTVADAKHIMLLQAYTKMKVRTARQDMLLEKDNIYVVPSRNYIDIVDGHFQFVSRYLRSADENGTDFLLPALADVLGDHIITILSPDLVPEISAALRVIRMEGGFTFCFEEETDYLSEGSQLMRENGMDFFLPAGKIADRLVDLADYFSSEGYSIALIRENKAGLSRVYQALMDRRNVDFSLYKPTDVARRILRRMVIHDRRRLEDYIELLDVGNQELEQLYQELLIYITGFFLDPITNHYLVREALPVVMKAKEGSQPLRIWIPQCTGGEEACTIAICVLEYLKERELDVPVQLFATDLNKAVIARARTGIFEEAALFNVSPRRLTKYFIKKGDQYQVAREIKEMCVFATHNLMKDPPFSHIDIIISRNLTVCMDLPAQKKVMQSFHYAMNPEGRLLLGKVRIDGFASDLFALLSEESGVYRRREVPASFSHSSFLPTTRDGEREADKLLLSSYVPACILIDEFYRVIRFYGDTEPYLRPSQDRLSLHLLKIVRDEMIFDLKDMLDTIGRLEKSIKREGILLEDPSTVLEVSVEVIPLHSFGKKWRLVIIREATAQKAAGKDAGLQPVVKDRRIQNLQREMEELRVQLLFSYEQSAKTQEALYAANQEIMSSNEELQSLNEELLSINQALDTTKNELQSFNVELNTVNEDLYQRNKGLELSVEYAHSIVAAIRQPLVVLQSDLRIRLANPFFYQLFGLTIEDVQGFYLYTAARGFFDIEELRSRLQEMVARKLPSLDLELKCNFRGLGDKIISFTATRMQESVGKRSDILLALEDVTDRRMVERFKDEFIGIASHELKTPATNIQAYSQLLYNEFLETNDQRSALLVSRLNSQVSRLTHLTKDLLDVTRISQGQITLRKNYFDINELIEEIVREMQMTTAIRITVSELSVTPPVWGDRERVGQVLSNLLSNAIKYSSGAEEVIVHTISTAENIHMSIQDFGIGMSTETIQRIFDRFYRSDDPSANRHPGLGLGLYIASEIIRRHGGAITVRSGVGAGSVFTAILPLGAPEQDQAGTGSGRSGAV